MDSREALIALNLIAGVGPVRVRQLLEHFGAAPAILQASRAQLQQVRGIGADTAVSIVNWEQTTDLAGELQRIADYGCQVVIPTDEHYPELLRQIYDPPIVLYVPLWKTFKTFTEFKNSVKIKDVIPFENQIEKYLAKFSGDCLSGSFLALNLSGTQSNGLH